MVNPVLENLRQEDRKVESNLDLISNHRGPEVMFSQGALSSMPKALNFKTSNTIFKKKGWRKGKNKE